MSIKFNEEEYNGIGALLLTIFVVLPMTFAALFLTFLVTAVTFLGICLILLSPFILIALVIAWVS